MSTRLRSSLRMSSAHPSVYFLTSVAEFRTILRRVAVSAKQIRVSPAPRAILTSLWKKNFTKNVQLCANNAPPDLCGLYFSFVCKVHQARRKTPRVKHSWHGHLCKVFGIHQELQTRRQRGYVTDSADRLSNVLATKMGSERVKGRMRN